MSAAYLVHQQHEDEAQHQGDADAGVELLVAVLVFPRGVQSCLCFALGLRRFHHPGLTVAVVHTWRNTSKEAWSDKYGCTAENEEISVMTRTYLLQS